MSRKGWFRLYLRDLAAAQTAGADLEGGVGLAHYGPNLVDVRLPDPAGRVVGVADVVARDCFLSADITLACHFVFSFYDIRYCCSVLLLPV